MTAKRKAYLAVACTLTGAVGAQAPTDGRVPLELLWGHGRELRASRHKIPGHRLGTGRFRGLQPLRPCTGRRPLQAGPGSGSGARVPVEGNAARSAAQPSALSPGPGAECRGARQAGRPRAPQVLSRRQPGAAHRLGEFLRPGLKRQDNDLVVIRDARSIAPIAETFERLWARPGNKVWRPER